MDHAHALDANAPHAAHAAHIDTSTGLDSRKMAFWGFIGSECLLFGSLIATYMAYKGRSIAGPKPHEGGWTNAAGEVMHHGVFNIPLTTFSTFILLMSSVAMVLALNYTQRGDRKRSALWLFLTAFGGAIFLGCQVYEFTYFVVHDGMTLKSNLFSSSFFVLTRSNWKFCSTTRVRGSESDVKVTVVGSMSAATSVNLMVERPFASFSGRSCRTIA